LLSCSRWSSGSQRCRRFSTPRLSFLDDARESDEERARRRHDVSARLSEQQGGSELLNEASLASLRERIDLVETKEGQLEDIRQMLRAMEPTIGVRFVGEQDEILLTAWVFVGLNVLVALYLAKALLVEPLLRSAAGYT